MQKLQAQKCQLLPLVDEIRERHPAMSVRVMYKLLRPDAMGRDRFEAFCFERGFRVKRLLNRYKTTRSLPHNPFSNLLENRRLTAVNQVWVSDITYSRLPGHLAYITVLMDLWSRFIVGYQVSSSLRTEDTTIPGIQMALQRRQPTKGLILHSDGGGQYYSQKLLTLTKQEGIRNSMGRSVYENAHAERIHQTLKNQYLKYYQPRSIKELKEQLDKVIYRYNYEKPHASLGNMTPAHYESLKGMRTKVIIQQCQFV